MGAKAKAKATPKQASVKKSIASVKKTIVKPPAMKAAGGKLAGKTIVFTGTLSMQRSVATAAAKSAGARVTGSVSKGTDIVVGGADAGSKLAIATALGIPIWSEAQFRKAA